MMAVLPQPEAVPVASGKQKKPTGVPSKTCCTQRLPSSHCASETHSSHDRALPGGKGAHVRVRLLHTAAPQASR